MIEACAPDLPATKRANLMGVGTPDDLLKSVARGIDQFDCVMPTRNAATACCSTRFGRLNLRNARHADDPRRSTRRKLVPHRARDLARLPPSSHPGR